MASCRFAFRLTFRLLSAVFLGIAPSVAIAQLQLPHVFSDHGVLQRERPIRVWGWDKPGTNVAVTFNKETAHSLANPNGAWAVWLPPQKAGGPYDLEVTGTTSAHVRDLLVGDVWLASGQSNMELPLKGSPGREIVGGKEALSSLNYPRIRLLRVEHESEASPQADIQSSWTNVSSTTAGNFSAVAFLFGRELHLKEDVPIGIIESSWGGTLIEAWISMDAFGQDASLLPVFSTYAAFGRDHIDATRNDVAAHQLYDAARAAHQPLPDTPWHSVPNTDPASLYNGMIAPIAGYGIKGVIWYQGESNAYNYRAPLYARLMTTLVQDWRSQWQQGDFPFLWVQLTSYHPGGDAWGRLRDEQRRSLRMENTAMAVTYDVGEADNIHPLNKPPVAARLALAARALAYGEKVEFSGPLFRQSGIDESRMRVWFDHASGMQVHGDALKGFEIAGADHHFVEADATIDGETVVVHSDKVQTPRYVRYAWSGDTPANLYNGAGLPASTFTSEEFK